MGIFNRNKAKPATPPRRTSGSTGSSTYGSGTSDTFSALDTLGAFDSGSSCDSSSGSSDSGASCDGGSCGGCD